MTDFDLYCNTDLATPIAAAMDSGDFTEAHDLATVGMDNAHILLCRIEDGESAMFSNRFTEITKLWSDLWTAKIKATNAVEASA